MTEVVRVARWDAYAASWSPRTSWVRSMAEGVAMEDSLQTVGDEWAPVAHVREIVDAFIMVSVWHSHSVCCLHSSDLQVWLL